MAFQYIFCIQYITLGNVSAFFTIDATSVFVTTEPSYRNQSGVSMPPFTADKSVALARVLSQFDLN
jgi:hypothetical protein